MKKNRFIPAAAFALTAVLCGAAIVFLPQLLSEIICTALIVPCVYFWLYFLSLEYHTADNTLYISGGLIFRRTHALPSDRILWQMRLSLPFADSAILTVLHTAGGAAVIFAEPPK
ncbi:MAG: hypothetical protein ACI4KM_00025 [Oscillospiraceae bacterium]